MKKLVHGLVRIVIGCACCLNLSGCKSTINKEAKRIISSYNEVKKAAEVKQGETLEMYDFKEGNPLHIIIRGDEGTKSIIYFDMDKDGQYDKKETLKIPKKLEVLGVFPEPNTPEIKKKFKEYTPNKERKEKEELLVYKN